LEEKHWWKVTTTTKEKSLPSCLWSCEFDFAVTFDVCRKHQLVPDFCVCSY
jgi:hypothetical protein